MGLALHWDFQADVDAAGAARLVGELHVAAGRAGFSDLGPVIEARAAVHADGTEAEIADRAWALSSGLRGFASREEPGAVVRVAPTHVVAFRAANPGTEDAVFGLATYDSPAAGPGYRWASGCATQGAARRGGNPAFLAAHRAVIAVLDSARTLGIKVQAVDDGNFWLTRDPKALLDKLHEWEMLAAALERRRSVPNARSVLKCDVLPRLQGNPRARKDQAQFEELEG